MTIKKGGTHFEIAPLKPEYMRLLWDEYNGICAIFSEFLKFLGGISVSPKGMERAKSLPFLNPPAESWHILGVSFGQKGCYN